jgi:uncharacterized protein YbaA (DUF1428 family)
MNARAVLAKLREHDIRVSACGERLLIDAPAGALTDDLRAVLTESKPEILAALEEDAQRSVRQASALVAYASSVLPFVRFTVRETGDTERDFTLLHRLRQIVEEHQPGGNRILLRVVTTDGRNVVLDWRAVDSRELRMDIARVLAEARTGS